MPKIGLSDYMILYMGYKICFVFKPDGTNVMTFVEQPKEI